MSGRQLAEWQAYAQIEPFGPPAAFWQAALIASMLANANRAKSTDKSFTPEDFMPHSMVDTPDAPSHEELGAHVLRAFQEMAAMQEDAT